MKPKTFVITALAAVVSSIAAVIVYTTHNQWDQGRIAGEKLVPALASGEADVRSLRRAKSDGHLNVLVREHQWCVDIDIVKLDLANRNIF